MKADAKIPADMLAPCGITCAVCYVHLREKNPCLGCRGLDISKPEHCRKCKIKDCATGQGLDFCFECPTFPCARIKRLDKSYRQRYRVSLVGNGVRAKTTGVEAHRRAEQTKWTCERCGGVISLHDRICSGCGGRMKI